MCEIRTKPGRQIPAVRSLLGRHASSLNETFAIYSRDLVCAPVAELQLVIDAIADGNFSPDSQRSEFFRKSHDSVAHEGEPGDHAEVPGDDLGPCQTELESNISELLECSGGGVGVEEGDQTVDLPTMRLVWPALHLIQRVRLRMTAPHRRTPMVPFPQPNPLSLNRLRG